MTVRDSSGEPISAPASVKVYKEGMPTDRKEASHGRAFFILRSLGDYTVVVDATGYKSAQKEVSVPVSVRAEVDVYVQKESATGDNTGIPGKPLLAPKAKEALDKGLQALNANKMAEAQRFVGEAMTLAWQTAMSLKSKVGSLKRSRKVEALKRSRKREDRRRSSKS